MYGKHADCGWMYLLSGWQTYTVFLRSIMPKKLKSKVQAKCQNLAFSNFTMLAFSPTEHG